MKKRILVDLPDDLINIETKKIIQALQKENNKLKTVNGQLISQASYNKELVEKAHKLIEAVREAGDFCSEWCEGNRA